MIDLHQEAELVGGGDCQTHWHSSSKRFTRDDVASMNANESSLFIGAGNTTIAPKTDYVIVNTATGNATLTLPQPAKMATVTVLRTSSLNAVTVNSPVGLINGGASYTLTATAYAHAKFKPILGNYYVVG